MKKRIGFVSNSSSSSFVLYGVEQLYQFQKAFPGVDTMMLEALTSRFKKIIEAEKELYNWFTKENAYTWDFIVRDFYPPTRAEDMLRELQIDPKIDKQQVWITAPVDRDEAYNKGCHFDIFMTDL